MSIIKSLLLSLRNKKRSKGVAIIEAALTLPIVCYLIFFMLELMKINLTQTAIETITQEATFYFIANGKMMDGTTNKIDAIIGKHRSSFIPAGNIRYYFTFYCPNSSAPSTPTDLTTGLAAMCFASPYGGEDITYSSSNTVSTAILSDPTSPRALISSDPVTATAANTIAAAGTAFVLTFSCSYVFSSPFVKMLFNGGVNSAERQLQHTSSGAAESEL